MLTTDHLSVAYGGGAIALHPTSLSFPGGGFTVLLGPSGAGKSTLLRGLNGLVRATSGRVLAEPMGDIAKPAAMRAHRRRTGMVFQQHHLIGRVTVLGNVLTGRLGHHSSLRSLLPLPRAERAAALRALDRVGLGDMALRRADSLSGGQQQRVGIARALVQQPDILLADEPVASLDPASAERVMLLLRDISSGDGLTAVVSLHQLALARQFADRIIGLAAGRVVFDGPPAALDDAAVAAIYGAPLAQPELEPISP
jgi:phosphonate transport system ATP-binding protein